MADVKSEHLAELKQLLAQVEKDLKKDVHEFGGDIEGHLRVAVVHLREIVRTQAPPPAAEPDEAPETEPVSEDEAAAEAAEGGDEEGDAEEGDAPAPARRRRFAPATEDAAAEPGA